MKKLIALILCLMLILSLAACGGKETDGQSDDAPVQAGTTDAAANTPESGEDTLSTDNSEATETTETTEPAAEAVPVPENIAVTNTTDGTDEQVTEFSGDAVYQDVADYIALLESMGFTVSEEFWNDGIYRVNATKDKASIYMEFIHDLRDDKFQEKVTKGEEISGPFSGRITVEK